MKQSVIIVFLALAALAGCAKKSATTGQSATLTLKDGTTAVGTVTNSDTSSITIQTASGVVSTYPLSQVASVNYGPGPETASTTAPAQPAPQQQSPPPASDPNAAPALVSQPGAEPPPASASQPPPAPVETFRTIPAGTTLSVRTNDRIDSRTAEAGQTYSAVVAHDVLDTNGQLAIPRGSSATLVVRDARSKGRVEGHSELALDVAEVRVRGRRYRLETSDFVEKGGEGVGANRRTAKFAGAGGVLGGIIGAVAGGGRGAAIGALSGAAAGAGAQTLTRKNVEIPAETLLSFRLEAPIRIHEIE